MQTVLGGLGAPPRMGWATTGGVRRVTSASAPALHGEDEVDEVVVVEWSP